MSSPGRNRAACVRALRKVAAFLDEITDEEFEDFVQGTLVVELVRRKKSLAAPATRQDNDAIIAELQRSGSRQAALDLLRSRKRSKAELMQIARSLSIYISKSDNLDAIEEKIVENIIGARLRSEAIQGVNLKGNSSEAPDLAHGETDTSPSRASKDARPDVNGTKRAMGPAERELLRDRLAKLASLLFTSTHDAEWWRRRMEADVPEIVDGTKVALAAFPESDDLRRNVRILRARLERVTDAARDGAKIGVEQTLEVANALTEVADSLMRLS